MRSPVAIVSVFAALFGSAAAQNLDAAFDILRKGEPIGVHAVDVERTPDGWRARSRIDMRVKVGPIVAFRYTHDATEIWKHGSLFSLTSRTNNNGKRMSLTVRREGEALAIDGRAFKGKAPLNAMPSSYWNRAIVDADRLLNTQNGEVIPIVNEELGRTKTPAGALADQHRITGSVALDLWYDGARWVGADFVVRGQALTYRLVDEAERQRLFTKLDLAEAP